MIGLWGGIAAFCGGIAGLVLGCVPGLHIVYVLALAAAFTHALPGLNATALLIGIVTGFSIGNGVPLALWDAPDDNKAFASPAASALRRAGRAGEAALCMATGALAAAALVAALLPVVAAAGAPLCGSVRAYRHVLPWILLALVLIRWVSAHGHAGRRRAGTALWNLAGLLTAGSLGALLLSRAPVQPMGLALAFVPAMIGLFTLPQLVGSLGGPVPGSQCHPDPIRACTLGRNLFYAVWSGMLLACLPAASGAGAGFVCSQFRERSARLRLFAQGACTTGFLTAGLVMLLSDGEYRLMAPPRYTTVMFGIALSAGIAYLAVGPLVQRLQRHIPDTTLTRSAILLCIACIVFVFGGIAGICALVAAGGLGLLLRSFSVDAAAGLGVVIAPLILMNGGL